nr:hypothetical protein [uncultured Gemmiger sp.]
MKKMYLAAAAALTAGALLVACGHPGAESMEVPGYPWDTTREELTVSLAEQGLPYTEEENKIKVEQAEFFDLPVYNLTFDYNTPTGELQGVLWNLDAGDKEAMEKKLTAYLGDPVDSCRPATFTLWDELSVYLASDYVSEDLICWHSAQPLSQTWDEEQRARFQKGYVARQAENGVAFVDQPADTINLNGEETTQWYGQEAMDTWFENNWDVNVWLTKADEETWVVSFGKLVNPF